MVDHAREHIPENIQSDDSAKESALETLVQMASQGERQQLIELCEQITKSVLSRVTRIVGNTSNAEDISQEILIRVSENIKYLREPKAFKVWLSKIIRNEVIRYYTKNTKHSAVLSIDDYLETIIEDKKEFLPQECAENAEALSAVMEAIPRLSERQREAVMLHYYDGLSVTEVAKVMNVTKQSVSEFLSISREKLKRELVKLGHISTLEG